MSDEAYKPTHYLLFGILYKEQMGPYSKWFEKYVRTQKKAKARDPGVVYMSITLPLLDKNL